MEGLKEGRIPCQKRKERDLPFPKVYFPGDANHEKHLTSLLETLKRYKHSIAEEVVKHRVLLLRGFPVQSASDFNDLVEALGWEEMPYIGYAPRTNIVGRIWTTNEGPLDRQIFFHHELAYEEHFPLRLVFYCEEAPSEGGETAILESDKVVQKLEDKFPDFVKRVEANGVVYHCMKPSAHNLPHHLNLHSQSWQSYFGTQDNEEAQQRANEKGWRLEWKADADGDDAEMISGVTVGLREFHGKRVWFNNIPHYFLTPFGNDTLGYEKLKRWITLGDGSAVGEDVIEEMAKIMNEECINHEWQKGDVVLIDNLTVMHARRPCFVKPRTVLVSLVK